VDVVDQNQIKNHLKFLILLIKISLQTRVIIFHSSSQNSRSGEYKHSEKSLISAKLIFKYTDYIPVTSKQEKVLNEKHNEYI
jgi:hypothetical protein